MPTDDEFTCRLIGFGLSEKEAQTYLHLLKYGPKTPSPLAKSLHTYREDVHRTLTSLIDRHGVMFVVYGRKHSIMPILIAASASLNTSMTALLD
jgi:sugar-specific transcriptional regulator TrmB